jgi:UDP-glucose 4-epimerase
VAKESAGTYLNAYREMYGLEGTALALGNVYGPRQDANGEAGVVAIFAGRLVAGEPCTIFGSGEQTRDFVYVDDVVDAFARAASLGDGELLNIGTGREVSINELFRAMVDAQRASTAPSYAPARPGELDRNCLDATRAKSVLGWSARTSLADGVRAVLEDVAGPT